MTRAESRESALLELHVAEARQLFNAMDPAPFRERDLDVSAAAYIIEWARDARADRPLALAVHLGREPATPEAASMLGDAVHEYFRQRANSTRRQLRQLFRIGRISLVIGVVFIAGAVIVGEAIASLISNRNHALLVTESFVIGGWVALWRPLQIFLYDWWPLQAEANLFDRLSEADVRLFEANTGVTSATTGATP